MMQWIDTANALGFDAAAWIDPQSLQAREDVRGMKYVKKSSFAGYEFADKGVGCDPYFLGHVSEVELEITSPHARVLAGFTTKVADTLEEICAHPLVVEHALGKGVVFTVTTSSGPGASGLRSFGENLVRSAVRAHRGDFELITGDTVRYAVYRTDFGSVVYCLNLDSDLYGDVRIVSCGAIRKEHLLLAPNEFKVFYRTEEGIVLIPETEQTFLERTGKMEYRLTGVKQNVRLLSLAAESVTFTLNRQEVTLRSGEEKVLRCAEYIPEEKAQYFTEEFLSEDVNFVMKNSYTPY